MSTEEDSDTPIAEIERQIGAMNRRWRVRDVSPVGDGYNDSYFLTVDFDGNERDCVLKVNSGDPEWVRVEARLYHLLDTRTDLPVPEVYASLDHHEQVSTPCTLMERLDGSHPPPKPGDLTEAERTHLARQFGRYLGEVHRLASVDTFGPVRTPADATEPGGTAGAIRDAGLVVETGREDWGTWLDDLMDHYLEHHRETRFSDLTPPIREKIERETTRMDASFAPVIGRIDHDNGNVLVDPDSMDVTGLIDWDMVHTVHAGYDLVCAEQSLTGLVPWDHARRRRVRAALHDGYSETNAVDTNDDLRQLYLLSNVVTRQLWLSEWVPEESADAIESRHRDLIQQLL